jgi:L-threonylcarbamoyladenylate synthase
LAREGRPTIIPASRRGALQEAARVLGSGGVVAFPTETVYGLAVRMGDAVARRRLRRVKGRAPAKPFQVLVSSRRAAVALCGGMLPAARRMARAFWPGPLTLVVRNARGRWVGVRVPNHPVATRLIRLAGGAVVATSANVSGRRPARTADEVVAALGPRVDLVLDGGRAPGGKASSVVRVRDDGWDMLRTDAISKRKLAAVIGSPGKEGSGQ